MEPSILKGDALEESSEYTRRRDDYATGEDEASRFRRARIKRLVTIFEEHGERVSKPGSDRELVELETQASKFRRADIAAVMQLLRKARRADLCFVVDATGSMASHIKQVKDVISQIVDELTKPRVPGKSQSSVLGTIRLACVAYRDHCDKEKRLEKLDFTADVSVFLSFLGNLQATGGGDAPEDVLGGLDLARTLSWSDDSGVKQIFHMGDAPPHGTKFHDPSMADDFPSGHPGDPAIEEIFSWINESNMFYIFGKITNHTDRMVQVIAKAAGKSLDTFDVKNPSCIAAAIKESVITSVDTVITMSKLPPLTVGYETRKYTLDAAMPDWAKVSPVEGRLQSYEMPKSIDDVVNDVALEKRSPKKVSVKIALNPFAEGQERIAYYGLDVTYSKTVAVVLKEFKRIGKGTNTANKYELVNQMQTIASFMAFRFTDELKKVADLKLGDMKFLKVKTFATETMKGKYRYMTCERMYHEGDTFVRFSNNAGYTMLEESARKCRLDPRYVDMIMAFTHWTYQITGGQLMIVDLQGIVSDDKKSGNVDILLTDPAIHSVDVTRYGPMRLPSGCLVPSKN